MDDLDAWINQLQRDIDRQTCKDYSEAFFQRWKNLTNVGRMEAPDVFARVKGSCGDTMEIYLRINGDRVIEASAFTDGCGSSIVCGSMAADMARGRTLEETMDLQGDDVEKALGGLPKTDRHCALLAAQTLREAVHKHLVKGYNRDLQGN